VWPKKKRVSRSLAATEDFSNFGEPVTRTLSTAREKRVVRQRRSLVPACFRQGCPDRLSESREVVDRGVCVPRLAVGRYGLSKQGVTGLGDAEDDRPAWEPDSDQPYRRLPNHRCPQARCMPEMGGQWFELQERYSLIDRLRPDR